MALLYRAYELTSRTNRFLRAFMVLQKKYSARLLEDYTLNSRDGNKHQLLEIIRITNAEYIFIFPPMSCVSCNQEILNKLSHILETVQNVVIITSPAEMNTIFLYSGAEHNRRYPIFLTEANDLFEFGHFNPYVLNVGEGKIIKSICILDRDNLDVLYDYLK